MTGQLFQDILDEIKPYKSTKALDALLPTIIFVTISRILNPIIAIILAIILSLTMTVFRLSKGHPWQYALGGLVGVFIAASGVLLSGQSKGYFLSSILNSLVIGLIAIVSLISRRPLAIWLSQLSHGWPIDWYQRKDVFPAYKNVTITWALLLVFRLFLQLSLYYYADLTQVAIANLFLSTPFTLIVLIGSYIYGLKHLQHLGGPSVKEYTTEQARPWQSQKKGF